MCEERKKKNKKRKIKERVFEFLNLCKIESSITTFFALW